MGVEANMFAAFGALAALLAQSNPVWHVGLRSYDPECERGAWSLLLQAPDNDDVKALHQIQGAGEAACTWVGVSAL